MTTIDRKLREVRKRLGLLQGELAKAIGVTQGTISRWETGGQSPDFQALMKVAELAGMDPWEFLRDDHEFLTFDGAEEHNVVAAVAQNIWVDAAEWIEPEQFKVRLPTPKSWNKLKLKGYVIQDDSCEPYFKKGSVVFIAVDTQVSPIHEDNVIVIRTDKNGLFEITVKEYYVNHKGQIYLSGISENPEWNSSLKVDGNLNDYENIPSVPPSAVVGIIVASIRYEDWKRFAGPGPEEAENAGANF